MRVPEEDVWVWPIETASPVRVLDCGPPLARPPLREGNAPGREFVVTSLERVRLASGLGGAVRARRVHFVKVPGVVVSVSAPVGAAIIASRSLQRRLARVPGVARLCRRVFGYRLAPPWPDLDATLRLVTHAVEHPAPIRRGRGVAHYIGSLAAGGAERQLSYLAARQQQPCRVLTVAPLEGPYAHYANDLQAASVSCKSLGRCLERQVLPELGLEGPTLELLERSCNREVIAPLIAELRRDPPEVLHCWLDESNVVGAIAGLLVGVPRIVIGTRNVNPSHFRNLHRPWLRSAYFALASSPRVTLTANSEEGGADYARWCGVEAGRFRVIHNGLDTSQWVPPSPAERAEARASLGVAEEEVLVVGVFRLAHEKRPLDFLEVLSQVHAEAGNLRAVHVGEGPLGEPFRARAAELGLTGAGAPLQILGRRRDMRAVLAAADICLLCSEQEGCPNVLLEAHALGIPAVTTAAGGAPEVVEDRNTGFVLPVGDLAGLSAALVRLFDRERRERAGRAARARICESFSVEVMVEAYRKLYQDSE